MHLAEFRELALAGRVGSASTRCSRLRLLQLLFLSHCLYMLYLLPSIYICTFAPLYNNSTICTV